MFLGRELLDDVLEALANLLKGHAAAREGKADTRRYAKRQFTWFRHQMPGWSWHSPDEAGEAVLTAVEARVTGQ